jgi:hypothetical protein
MKRPLKPFLTSPQKPYREPYREPFREPFLKPFPE